MPHVRPVGELGDDRYGRERRFPGFEDEGEETQASCGQAVFTHSADPRKPAKGFPGKPDEAYAAAVPPDGIPGDEQADKRPEKRFAKPAGDAFKHSLNGRWARLLIPAINPCL
ncbi:MAG: hypothetical protein BWY66_00641 [bacterium ADurb.Bin374]|nr:MAG: hypothetical protein BWY66_00641 [bacterium ADurb.Bin374]